MTDDGEQEPVSVDAAPAPGEGWRPRRIRMGEFMKPLRAALPSPSPERVAVLAAWDRGADAQRPYREALALCDWLRSDAPWTGDRREALEAMAGHSDPARYLDELHAALRGPRADLESFLELFPNEKSERDVWRFGFVSAIEYVIVQLKQLAPAGVTPALTLMVRAVRDVSDEPGRQQSRLEAGVLLEHLGLPSVGGFAARVGCTASVDRLVSEIERAAARPRTRAPQQAIEIAAGHLGCSVGTIHGLMKRARGTDPVRSGRAREHRARLSTQRSEAQRIERATARRLKSSGRVEDDLE